MKWSLLTEFPTTHARASALDFEELQYKAKTKLENNPKSHHIVV